ncbi:MerC domain-containing protein [Pacificimonas flava]|uniref:MerC mercury resistance protein n=1 Tax=Pacificimonas flava TaxID=1234595 RepID=M2TQ22_9SPHN|nr:MerC domain-containing protein [Pacificimonas flava]EMD83841.1 hypothetical protein C725_0813 [Pacificimonas flava]MBB5281181.1 membrane protein implicated in regulation of membrane protease activity [Pacificimonas flava]
MVRKAAPLLSSKKQRLLDAVAIAASMLCLVHCLLLPALLLAVPALALYLALPESFHAAAFLFAVPTSAAALWAGRRRAGSGPAALAAAGLCLLGIGAFAVHGEAAETGVSVIGALILAAAHILNWRRMRCEGHRRSCTRTSFRER